MSDGFTEPFGEGPLEEGDPIPPADSQSGTDPTASRDEDQELARTHDDDGIDLAVSIARATRGEPSGTPRPRFVDDVPLPPPRREGGRNRRGRRRGAAGKGHDPVPVGDALTELIAAKGWGRRINLHLVLAKWPELVGQANAEHSRPVSYENRVLTVSTDATVWATSLRAIAPQLVAELNRRLGEGTVTRVLINGPTAPSWKHGPRSVPGRGPRDTYG